MLEWPPIMRGREIRSVCGRYLLRRMHGKDRGLYILQRAPFFQVGSTVFYGCSLAEGKARAEKHLTAHDREQESHRA